jgi:hypothetical protein
MTVASKDEANTFETYVATPTPSEEGSTPQDIEIDPVLEKKLMRKIDVWLVAFYR